MKAFVSPYLRVCGGIEALKGSGEAATCSRGSSRWPVQRTFHLPTSASQSPPPLLSAHRLPLHNCYEQDDKNLKREPSCTVVLRIASLIRLSHTETWVLSRIVAPIVIAEFNPCCISVDLTFMSDSILKVSPLTESSRFYTRSRHDITHAASIFTLPLDVLYAHRRGRRCFIKSLFLVCS